MTKAAPVGKLLASAVANAENNYNMDKSNLYVAECFACPADAAISSSSSLSSAIDISVCAIHRTFKGIISRKSSLLSLRRGRSIPLRSGIVH